MRAPGDINDDLDRRVSKGSREVHWGDRGWHCCSIDSVVEECHFVSDTDGDIVEWGAEGKDTPEYSARASGRVDVAKEKVGAGTCIGGGNGGSRDHGVEGEDATVMGDSQRKPSYGIGIVEQDSGAYRATW